MAKTNEEKLFDQASLASQALFQKFGEQIPDYFIQAGTGLQGILDPREGYKIEVIDTIPFSKIDGFPEIKARDHGTDLVLARLSRDDGSLDSKLIAVAKGRKHVYEYDGIDQQGQGIIDVCTVAVSMALLGVDKYIITNAAGGLQHFDEEVPYLMGITDHKNDTDVSILKGPVDGPLFPFYTGFSGKDKDMPYQSNLLNTARVVAEENKIPFKEGRYVVQHSSRRYETPAETNDLMAAGYGAVGASTVFSVEALTGMMQHKDREERDLQILGVSAITNHCATEENPVRSNHVANAGEILNEKGYLTNLIFETMLRN
ncbi:hypothetical protein HN789_06495 [archaeon]|jgi:purine nucleoside phosphorylase|nr:hypothetical protein [archaeon]MBT4022787.1 hypothetical protein [archaeon]MBT4273019.1 hypothetical protein [archaeon]MBT4460890.1 hypothetical protein [archaeon]MBT4858106.1 hypothetical protein [archaeon]